ncbi:MAG: T9SS type A sorting domain-containing protein [Flavobacteriales bacterium]|nr:T9SS type A sorting domain-containing protein [Flavobacteriales bacterium]
MRKSVLIFFLCLGYCVNYVEAQNLVPNPSFEDTVYCPVSLSDMASVSFWTSPTDGSPDYFNACNGTNASVPNNDFGTQAAVTGNSYIGISVYDTQTSFSYREYAQVELEQTLTASEKYWVSFYVSLADLTDYGIQEFGAYFSSNEVLDNLIDTTLMFTPQVEFGDSIITDKNNWIRVSGSFIATGGENYILIGNFNRTQSTTASQVSNTNADYAYYYLDDVCVSSDSITCVLPVGITGKNISTYGYSIFPNPISNQITITQPNFYQPYDLKIYNSLGQLLYEEYNITTNDKIINATQYAVGLLYVDIKTANQNFKYKLLKP